MIKDLLKKELKAAKEVVTQPTGDAGAGANEPQEPRERPRRRDHRDLAGIAPVTRHSLDPVTSPWDVSRMAGFNGQFHDSMQGVDQMVMGNVDALAELEAPSSTPGTPMDVHPSESILFGQQREDILDEHECPSGFDWCRWL